MAARAIWTGSIGFGLVTIPVRLFSAVREREVHFHMLSAKTHARLRRKMVSSEDDSEVSPQETVRGYEIAPDQYVIIEDKELESLRPQASRAIDIKDFVDLAEIDPIYYERPYYLLPDERGTKAYRLLHEAMRRAGKTAIATFVMRQKEYLVAIRPLERILCLETMRFADEIVPIADLPDLPREVELDKRELEMAHRLIETLVTKFDPHRYHDEYRERLLELIERKAAGQEIVVQPAPERPPQIINLMDALRASLAETEKRRAASGQTPAAAPKGTRRTRRKASA